MPRINIYSKEECDANFAGAAEVEAKADKADTYTKTETDALMQQERLARADADENLQDQIDLLEAGSDVKDVVGTYAELQAYDVTTLNPNDIIKVLSDSTHDGAETYYRWIVEGGVGAWQFIGAKARTYTAQETDLLLDQKADKADTYTKAETDNLLLTKQDVLVFDGTPRSGSTNPVTSRGIKDALDTKQGQLTASTGITIGAGNIISADCADAPISGSDRPITSGAVKTALDAKQDVMTLDTQPRSGSTNAIMSGGVYDALLDKQNKLTAGTGITLGSGSNPTIAANCDTVPTSGSSKPVTSGGVRTALTDIVKTIKVKIIGTGETGQPPTLLVPAGTVVRYNISSYVNDNMPSNYRLAGDGTMFCTSIGNDDVICLYFYYYSGSYSVALKNLSDSNITLNNMWMEMLVVKK